MGLESGILIEIEGLFDISPEKAQEKAVAFKLNPGRQF
jgi:hypothetical protein